VLVVPIVCGADVLLLTARYGGVEAATFCALMTLYDALHHEACVDVYTVSKLYCMKRPGIWPTEVRSGNLHSIETQLIFSQLI